MSGFTKLVPEIIQSSIWSESSDVRCVWISMLALVDSDGYVRGDAKTLSRMANVPQAAVDEALEKFLSPDPSSHTPDNEGRRIAPAPGGWIVLNYHLYRGGDKSEYMREYMRKYRSGNRKQVNSCKVNSKPCSASASASKVEGCGEKESLPYGSTEFASAWSDWVQHRKEIRHPLKPKTVEAQLELLKGMGESAAIASIQQSITNGWQGLFEPKGSSKPRKGESREVQELVEVPSL